MHKLALLRPQFLIYLCGGVLCALIDIGLMQWLLGRGVSAVGASSAGFVLGLLVNYAFHAKVTFSRMTGTSSFMRFLCLVALNYLITIMLVSLTQTLLGNALAGKLLSLPVVAVNGFLLGKYWIFK